MPTPSATYVIRLTHRGNPLSVMKGKLYRIVRPYPNDAPTDIRIIDEEKEDYPYPLDWFPPSTSPCPSSKPSTSPSPGV